MAIPSRQIGWSQESNLLWNISKQLERLSGIMGSIPVSSPSVEFYANLASFPLTGSNSVIYVAEDTELIYRWDGAAYVELSSSGVAPLANTYTYTGSPVLNPYFAASIETNNYFSISGVTYGPYNIYSAINNVGTCEPYVTGLTFNFEAISIIRINTSQFPSLTTASYPNLIIVSEGPVAQTGASIQMGGTTLTTFSAPLLLYCNNGLSIQNCTALNSINLNSLKSVNGNITLQNSNSLTTLSLPSLLSCNTLNIGSNLSLVSISLPVVTSISNILFNSVANFTTLNLPSIEHIAYSGSNSIQMQNLTNFTTFSFGASLLSVGGNVNFSGDALNQSSIDNILVRLAALDGTLGTISYDSKTITLTGGTNSTPSATGLAAKAVLVARGCTVTNN